MKKAISLFLCLAMLMGMMNLSIVSAGASGVTGTGAEETPYIITTGAQFKEYVTAYPDAYFEIRENLDLTGDNNVEIGTESAPFNGTIIGNYKGKGIKPVITISKNSTDDNVGFVNFLGTGKISNLKLKGTITAASRIGGAVGNISNAGTVEKIDNYVVLSSTHRTEWETSDCDGRIGGIAGIISYRKQGVVISECNNYADIIPVPADKPYEYNISFLGGIVGYADPGTHQITKCYNYGMVKGRASLGGIVGNTGSSSTYAHITNCANFGKIGEVMRSANSGIGGIIGAGIADIDRCYNTGYIVGGNSSAGIAGVSKQGSSASATVTITNSFNTANGRNGHTHYAGIITEIKANKINLSNNYSINTSNGNSVYPAYQTADYQTEFSFANNYFYSSTGTLVNPTVKQSGEAVADISGHLPVSLTEEQMMSEESFGFDFENVWMIDENDPNGYYYPQLKTNPYKVLADLTNTTVSGIISDFNSKANIYDISWEKVSSAEYYQIRINNGTTDILTDLTSDTEYAFTPSDNGEYTVYVKAYGPLSESNEGTASLNQIYAGGDGTKQNPYLIANETHFANIALNNNVGVYFSQTKDFTITEPLDIVFKAIYKGNNKHITLDIDKAASETLAEGEKFYVGGMFAKINEGQVYDLVLEGSINVKGAFAVGGIAGYSDSKTSYIQSCVNKADITSDGFIAGGLIGESGTASGTAVIILESSNEGDITTTGISDDGEVKKGTGGLLGYGALVSMTDSSNKGAITAYTNVGGVVGYLAQAVTPVEGVSNIGRIKSTIAKENANSNAGGIVGYIGSSNKTTIKNSYNSGPVSGIKCVGGIAGNANGSLGDEGGILISDCFNTAVIDGNGSIIGSFNYNKDRRIRVTNCYDIANPKTNAVGGVYTESLDGVLILNNVYILTTEDISGFNGSPVAVVSETLKGLFINNEATVWQLVSGYEYPQIIDNPYEKLYYAISIKLGEGGETEDDVVYVLYGEDTEITITPESNYSIKSVQFNDEEEIQVNSKEEYTFKTPAIVKDSVLTVAFEIDMIIPEIISVFEYTGNLSVVKDLYKLDGDFIGKSGALVAVKTDIGSGYKINGCGVIISETEDYNIGNKIESVLTDSGFAVLVYGAANGGEYYLTPYIEYGEKEIIYSTPVKVTLKSFSFY